ncbi:class I SAM-dependent methyltransferase [Rudaeicoccus suwonensis]|uniref:Ubiquinone/menaquinone biosynthesis C-methylase UbiE n=1 Tax=Rudaeicoccus suwonensis TaxID=657409 RepID=A0A561E767_9MICO|nr:class I SAM-dependent methyltransferase [Rudaeicoccus suwonensis]TWE11444.1 ubiquinone/menaquinone biosynthesis C-methylase UbiE [Rudaeicoccus suwonensis]
MSTDERPGRIAATYDTIATDYAESLRDELGGKPLDRALLAAVVEMCDHGTIADLGCGPGHVTRHLASIGADALGIDISPAMIAIAEHDAPDVRFEVASMTDLALPDESLGGVVMFYSIIHLSPGERARAFSEVHRVLRSGGIALVAFHIRSEEFAPGETNHMHTWFGHSVDIDGYFLEPEQVIDEIADAGLDVVSVTTRLPHPGIEVASERAYVLAQKPGPTTEP